MTGPVIVDARRTPVSRRHGALAGADAEQLAAAVLAAVASGLPEGLRPDDVVLGSSRPVPGNLARVAALAAGLGVHVPGVTVDRQCGGGLEAVRLAAALVGSGAADVVLAGGVDSASTTDGPAVTTGPSPQARFAPSGHADPPVGAAADALGVVARIDRAAQDAYAARSYRLTRAAQASGAFGAELVPVGEVVRDDPPRSLDLRTLGRLRPAFAPEGTVTAGNASGIADGAAVVTVVSEPIRARHHLPGLRVLGSAVAGCDPALPGLGAVEATRALLERAGLRPGDLAVLEVTEAFAVQVLALTRALGLPDPAGAVDDAPTAPLVCPDGGAIALGHPWGASGAILLTRLFGRLVRQPGSPAGTLAVATCAIAGGQGVALLLERVG